MTHMGIFDNIADAAKQHESTIEEGIEKAGDLIDEKTGGKFADQVDKVQDLANQGLDKLTGDDK
ncbi:MAG TPA: antitoxin [Arachnia sp.]|nr:antitoxin [Arachnia sp.]